MWFASFQLTRPFLLPLYYGFEKRCSAVANKQYKGTKGHKARGVYKFTIAVPICYLVFLVSHVICKYQVYAIRDLMMRVISFLKSCCHKLCGYSLDSRNTWDLSSTNNWIQQIRSRCGDENVSPSEILTISNHGLENAGQENLETASVRSLFLGSETNLQISIFKST